MPTAATNVIIPQVPSNQPALTAASTAHDVFLSGVGSTLTLNGFSFIAGGALTNFGTIIADGSEPVIGIGVQDAQHGTWEFVGPTGNSSAPIFLPQFFPTNNMAGKNFEYNDLIINDTHNDGGFQISREMDIANDFSVLNGTYYSGTLSGATLTPFETFGQDDLTVNGTYHGGSGALTKFFGSVSLTGGTIDLTGGGILEIQNGPIFGASSTQPASITGGTIQ